MSKGVVDAAVMSLKMVHEEVQVSLGRDGGELLLGSGGVWRRRAGGRCAWRRRSQFPLCGL